MEINREVLIKDQRRTEKIERDLRNKKRPWFIRQWGHRTLIQWLNLALGIWLIISVIWLSPKPWDWIDLIVMAAAGFNIGFWLWGGFLNQQNDFIEELLELSKKSMMVAEHVINDMRSRIQYMG